MVDVVGILEQPDYMPEQESEPPLWRTPRSVIPTAIPMNLLLGHAADAAVALLGMLAYPNGYEFTVAAFLSRNTRVGRMLDPEMHRLYHRARLVGEPSSDPPPSEFLRIGVQYSDGNAVTNVDIRPLPAPDVEPNAPLMIPVLVSCDRPGGRCDVRFWAWPLPPPGPIAFVCQWPAAGIDESRVMTDADLILNSARRCTRLWPED